MARGGRPTQRVVLGDEERKELERLTRARTSAQALAMRARVILLSAQGLDDKAIAEQVPLSNGSVGKWRRRFNEFRLAGLTDAPRSGAPRSINDERIAEVLRLTLESKPKNATHWSTRSMARKVGISHDRVAKIWRTFALQPHRSETFQLSTDPFFVEKVRDVVGLYMSPPENALVLCLDEKTQCQALERSQPIFPMRPGIPERQTHDYFRHGTTTLFAALDVATGEVYSQCRDRHTSADFLAFLKHLDRQIPAKLQLHVVMDNYATHKTEAVQQWLAANPRWHFHFIPTHSSWLNQVERFFAKITVDLIRRGSFRSLGKLRKAIRDYIKNHNQDPKPFRWTANAEHIFAKLHKFCHELA